MWFCSLVLVVTINSVVNAEDSQEATTAKPVDCIGCDQDIPIDFGNKVNEFDTYADFIREMIDLNTIDQRDQVFLLGNGSVDDSTLYERSVAIRPKPAACIPDVSIVSLRPETDTDPTMVYFPSCTRVKRCGGCCSHKLLSESSSIYSISILKYFRSFPQLAKFINNVTRLQVVNPLKYSHMRLR